MRVLVCGGRDFTDSKLIRGTLAALHQGSEGPITFLCHGNARGTDTIAGAWAQQQRERYIVVCPCPAQWAKHGKRAGPIRNQNMLGHNIHLVIAFPGGRGTADMVARARKAGIEVRTPSPAPSGRRG